MNETLIQQTLDWVTVYMKHYDESHDIQHVLRVKHYAIQIAKHEKMSDQDTFEVILAALTHDIADYKYSVENQQVVLEDFFKDKLDPFMLYNVVYIACNTSLSKEINIDVIDENVYQKLICVRDADRLDSLGSIGISRYFMYGILHKHSTIQEIITNMERRTSNLMNHIKTPYGLQLANEKYKIIKLFIDDFNLNIFS
jgi:uncharacterized protein